MKGGLIVWADSPLKIDAYRACGRGSSGAARGVGVIRKLSFSCSRAHALGPSVVGSKTQRATVASAAAGAAATGGVALGKYWGRVAPAG